MHSVEHIYLRQQCFDASKRHIAASTGAQYHYVGFSQRNKKFHIAVHTTQSHVSLLRHAPKTDFPDVIKFRVAVHTLWEQAIRFYDPDRAQKLISSSVWRHLSTCNISSMHVFLSILAHRYTARHYSVGALQIQVPRQKHIPPPLSEVNEKQWIILMVVTKHFGHVTFYAADIESDFIRSKVRKNFYARKILPFVLNAPMFSKLTGQLKTMCSHWCSHHYQHPL